MKKKRLIIIGASGHGKVLLDIALKNEYEVLGFLDDDASKKMLIGYPVLGGTNKANDYLETAEFVIGIGSNMIRQKIDKLFEKTSISWATLIHPSAVIGTGVTIAEGTVVMANAVINPFASIGKHCIINTSAVVEHDNQIKDYVHISPGAVLAGTVRVGECTHVGAGAVIKNNLRIVKQSVIGAGAVVVKDIFEPGTYAGVPAKKIEKLK